MQFNLYENNFNIKLQLCAAFNWLCSRSDGETKHVKMRAESAGSISFWKTIRTWIFATEVSPIEFWLIFNLIYKTRGWVGGATWHDLKRYSNRFIILCNIFKWLQLDCNANEMFWCKLIHYSDWLIATDIYLEREMSAFQSASNAAFTCN